MEIKLNHSNNNPFYGLKNCLSLFNNSNSNISYDLLDNCYKEVENNKEKKEMFYSLLFSIGDITARQHNIFKGIKKDSGGNANREGFYTIFMWLKEKHFDQFVKFLKAGLFNEYSCFDLLFKSRVKTNKARVIEYYDIFEDKKYCKVLLEYVYSIINGTNTFNKALVAKFLTLPRMTKRKNHNKMLPETRKVMEHKAEFLIDLSKEMNWEYQCSTSMNFANFIGYRKWRKEFNGELESVLFSSGQIKNFDKTTFITWFDKLPAQARFRVKNRILYSTIDDRIKYPDLKKWYYIWEQYKLQKQQEQRELEEKIRQGQASLEDKEKLKKVKKEAKVTVGATNFHDLYNEICSGKIDKLKLESFMNKVNLPYNSLVIIDDSGSMTGAPFNFATFMASVCLCKNPDDTGRNLLGFFNGTTHWHSFIDKTTKSKINSIFTITSTQISPEPFVNPKLSFIENYKRIDNFCNSVFNGGWTNISGIPEGLNSEIKRNPQILDELKSYPVWTIISDGEWNNLDSPEASMNDFMHKCQCYFGFKPFIIAIDINDNSYFKKNFNSTRFSGIENMIYIPSNPAQIEMFLTNFKDIDIFDIYTPLQSIYRSNRYEIVRKNIL